MSRCLLLVFVVTFGAAQAAIAEPVEERLRARIQLLFDDTEVTSVTPSPIPGVYEVMLGPSLIYMSKDGRYVLRGDMLDLDQRVNVSDQKRALARKQSFESLDAGQFVEFPAAGGKVRKTLYVYTDIDCAYCRKMHREVPQLNEAGISVRYLAFPRSGLKGESFKKAAAVWCSADRRKAMTEAKAGKNISAKTCKNPVASQFNLGQAMGVSGTPAVYTDAGEQIGGYVPAAELIAMVRDGKI